MASVLSIVLRNYRRFRGEIELPLSGGIDIVQTPRGMGKSSIAEAVAWCLAGGMPMDDVMNAEGRRAGEDTMVSLTFSDPCRTVLERSIAPSAGGWGERTQVRPEGSFEARREELFPGACIDSNLISGISLERVLGGARTGGERMVERVEGWGASDAPLQASMEGTALFLAMVPEPAVSCIVFDQGGRPGVRCDSAGVSADERRAVVLAAALAFARESCPGVPIILDEPFMGMDGDAMARTAEAVAEFMDGRQLVLLLSEASEIEAMRSTGRVGKELEIKG
jgi:hypothetical protein